VNETKADIDMKVLSIKEVAIVLNLSRWTITEMLQSGQLPGFIVKSGRRKRIWRVSEPALTKWIEKQELATKKRISGETDR